MSSAKVRMERATLGSILIHCAAALAIPALAWTASDTPPVETVSFTHILRVQITHPPKPLPHPRAAAPHFSVAPTINFTHKIKVAKLAQRAQSSKKAIPTNAPAAPAVAAVTQAGDSSSQATTGPVSTTSPPPVRKVASEDAHRAGGYLPFGAEQPTPVLDPAVRKQLEALDAHVTLIVTVGDDGRTTEIVFQPPIDPQLEGRIRSLLADANWDPAVCGGGVSCEAQATIKL